MTRVKSASDRTIHPKLPSGFGCVRYLGKGRRKPYAVHPTSAGTASVGAARANGVMHEGPVPGKAHGRGARPAAICYVASWYTGVAVLMAWNSGNYVPGMEREIDCEVMKCTLTDNQLDAFCRRMLDYAASSAGIASDTLQDQSSDAGDLQSEEGLTLQQAFDRYFEYKFGAFAPKELSESTQKATLSIFKKLAEFHGRPMDSISVDELQTFINSIRQSRSTVSKVIYLIRDIYKYAISRQMCSRNPTLYIEVPDTPEGVHHQDFTDIELMKLWEDYKLEGDPITRNILIMCYSGFRFSAYASLETNLKDGYFRGGIKTAAGRDRIVPIHSKIEPLVRETVEEGSAYMAGLNIFCFGRRMQRKMHELGIDGIDECGNVRHHTMHSCRHTFSRLCESYGVRDADRKRMLGHALDITNGVYGHRSLKELKGEIEKIKVSHPSSGASLSG